MMLRAGIDIVELKRAEALYQTYGQKIGRFLSREEKAFLRASSKPAKALAKLLAVKEAVFKALEIHWFGLTGWRKIGLKPKKSGHFEVCLTQDLCHYITLDDRIWVSVASTKDFVLARVLIEDRGKECG